ncbi:hypothetical protein O1611_g8601 [Lasiodiplodia mahajangana]|uniref:Uncharacterized protein n=1 Tax=Lasiodiplodia mahajangana TaxID=1108764 RepID=A0ACC2JC55_9PEZI|nr:hypothetical protein O1611_g8601 [Lasiodiplodia mahajangana]
MSIKIVHSGISTPYTVPSLSIFCFPSAFRSSLPTGLGSSKQHAVMVLADSAIVGIVALLVMSIPGVKWFLKLIRRKLRSRRKRQPSSRNTVLPLSNRSPRPFGPLDAAYIDPCVASHAPIGMMHQTASLWEPPSPIIPGCQGVVTISMNAAVIWPAVELQPCRTGGPSSHAGRGRQSR